MTPSPSFSPQLAFAVSLVLAGALVEPATAQRAAPARPTAMPASAAAAGPHLIRRYPAFHARWNNDTTLTLSGIESIAGHDLNGDGDILDGIPMIADLATGALQVVPRAAVSSYWTGDPAPRFIALTTNELAEGVDLDGSGFLSLVAEVFDTRTSTIRTIVTAESGVAMSRGSLYTQALEDSLGQDVNGDGFLLDAVDIVHSFLTGHTRLLGVGQNFLGFAGDGQILLGRFDPTTLGTGFVTAYDPTDDSTTPLPLSGLVQVFDNSDVRWLLEVEGAALQDMNGDGDTADRVIVTYDSATRTVTNTGVDTDWALETEDALHFVTLESTLGVDSNGDGDMLDGVFTRLDLDTGVLTSSDVVLEIDHHPDGSWDIIPGGVGPMQAAGPWLYASVWLSPASLTRTLVVIDTTTGVSEVLSTDAEPAGSTLHLTYQRLPRWVDDRWAVWLQPESTADLNGDGDVDPADLVLHVREHATGTVQVIPFACRGHETWIEDGLAVSIVDEARQGADLNGDGDLDDGVPFGIDLATGKRVLSGVAGQWVVPQPGGALMSFREQVPAGLVLTVIDLRTGERLSAPDVGTLFPLEQIRGRHAAVPRDEGHPDVGDLNGDGDTDDRFVELWRF